MSAEQTLDTFFAAIERADVAAVSALYADDATVWHSNDKITQNKAENLRTLGFLTKVAILRYTVLERVISGESVAQRHRVEISVRASGRKATSDAAIFFTIRDGRIQHIDEYIDSGSVRELTALFS
ncbi:MAG: nuclear transport factor 2 family protein [Terricaulis sp.]